jgi:hypothetical protein
VKKLWFKHDVCSLSDDKLSALILEYGAEGYAVFYAVIEALYENNGNPISVLTLKRIAKDLRLDNSRVLEIADYAASEDCGNLLVKSKNGYESARVTRSITESEETSKKRKEAIKNRWKNTKSEKINTIVSKTDTNVCQNDTDKDKDKDKDRDISISPNVEIENICLSSTLDKPRARAGEETQKPIIYLNDGGCFQVTDKYVFSKQKAYPKVDVMAELWKIDSKTQTTPQARPARINIDGYVNAWLQNETNKLESNIINARQHSNKNRNKMAGPEVWDQLSKEFNDGVNV